MLVATQSAPAQSPIAPPTGTPAERIPIAKARRGPGK